VKHDEPLTERPAGPAGTGPQEPPVEHLRAGVPPGAVSFERVDVTTRPVAKALAILVVATIVVVALLVPLFGWYLSRARESDPPPPPMGRHQEGRLPAEPRLQTTPVQDLAAIRGEEERLLRSYGWVDEQKGIARIPIETAMQLIAQRGLPAAPAGASATAAPGAPAAGAAPPQTGPSPVPPAGSPAAAASPGPGR
jgi:hypothetical protein